MCIAMMPSVRSLFGRSSCLVCMCGVRSCLFRCGGYEEASTYLYLWRKRKCIKPLIAKHLILRHLYYFPGIQYQIPPVFLFSQSNIRYLRFHLKHECIFAMFFPLKIEISLRRGGIEAPPSPNCRIIHSPSKRTLKRTQNSLTPLIISLRSQMGTLQYIMSNVQSAFQVHPAICMPRNLIANSRPAAIIRNYSGLYDCCRFTKRGAYYEICGVR